MKMKNRFSLLLLFAMFVGSLELLVRERITLSGPWERAIGGVYHDTIRVPSSYRPVGVARGIGAEVGRDRWVRRRVDGPAVRPYQESHVVVLLKKPARASAAVSVV